MGKYCKYIELQRGKLGTRCGRAARWWYKELKEKISLRREVYKKVIKGREDLWDEYCRLRREVKELGRERSLPFGMRLLRK